MRARRPAIRPMTRCHFAVPVLAEGDVNARVWIRIREVEQSLDPDRADSRPICPPVRSAHRCAGACRRGVRAGRGLPRRHLCWVRLDADWPRRRVAICATRPGSSGRYSKQSSRATSSPISRCATNPSTAPTRGTICRSASHASRLLFGELMRGPLTEPAPPDLDERCARRTGAAGGPGGAPAARAQPVDPPGRCRLVQRLRARDPCTQQRLLRPRALRPALRRLAAPRRRAARDRPGDRNMREALYRTWAATPDPKWVVAVGDCALDGGIFEGILRRRRRRFGSHSGRSAHPGVPAGPCGAAPRFARLAAWHEGALGPASPRIVISAARLRSSLPPGFARRRSFRNRSSGHQRSLC